jgi:hypothetical protein
LRAIAGFRERIDLGMWPAGKFVRAAADNHTISVNHESTDHRVRARPPAAPLSQRQRARHKRVVVLYHLAFLTIWLFLPFVLKERVNVLLRRKRD